MRAVNLFTQRGESPSHGAAEEVRRAADHAGRVGAAALLHGRPLPERAIAAYAAQGSHRHGRAGGEAGEWTRRNG